MTGELNREREQDLREAGAPALRQLCVSAVKTLLSFHYHLMKNIVEGGAEKSFYRADVMLREDQVVFSPENNRTFEINF